MALLIPAVVLVGLCLVEAQLLIKTNGTAFALSAKDHNDANETIRQLPNFIIGGNPVNSATTWPWQVRIHYTATNNNTYLCGGTLISKRHVLTAGHCGIDMVAVQSYAFMGIVSEAESQQTDRQGRVITKITVHPDYNPTTLHADIAVLEVHKDFTFSRAVKTVQLRYDDSKILDSVKTLTATGWGVYDPHDDTKTSTTLREVQVPLIPHNTCKKWWNLHVANSDVDDSMICAGGIGKGTGQGDSGGPLLAFYNNTYIQVGLTSFGVNSPEGLYDQYDFPAVYTRVSKYCDFISKATGKMATCGANGTMYFFAIITAIASYALLH